MIKRTPFVLLVLLLAVAAAACVDPRASVNAITASVASAASPNRQPDNAGAEPAVLNFAAPEIAIIEPVSVSDGPISAFGLRWIAVGKDGLPIVVRDQPGLEGVIVSELPASSADFWVAERTHRTGAGLWRHVTLADGSRGWVLAELLIAQEPAH